MHGMLSRAQRVQEEPLLGSPPIHATLANLHPWQLPRLAGLVIFARLSSTFSSSSFRRMSLTAASLPASPEEVRTLCTAGGRRCTRCDSASATRSISGAARSVELAILAASVPALAGPNAAFAAAVADRRLACRQTHSSPSRLQRTHSLVLTAGSHLQRSFTFRHSVHARRRGAEGSHRIPSRMHRVHAAAAPTAVPVSAVPEAAAPEAAPIVSEQLHLAFWQALHALRSASIRPASSAPPRRRSAGFCSASHTQKGRSQTSGTPSHSGPFAAMWPTPVRCMRDKQSLKLMMPTHKPPRPPPTTTPPTDNERTRHHALGLQEADHQ